MLFPGNLDLDTEKAITLAEAADLVGSILPSRRSSKVSKVTVYSWATTGLRGVKLEAVCIGGVIVTSKEALYRFFRASSTVSNMPLSTRRTKNARTSDISSAYVLVNGQGDVKTYRHNRDDSALVIGDGVCMVLRPPCIKWVTDKEYILHATHSDSTPHAGLPEAVRLIKNPSDKLGELSDGPKSIDQVHR